MKKFLIIDIIIAFTFMPEKNKGKVKAVTQSVLGTSIRALTRELDTLNVKYLPSSDIQQVKVYKLNVSEYADDPLEDYKINGSVENNYILTAVGKIHSTDCIFYTEFIKDMYYTQTLTNQDESDCTNEKSGYSAPREYVAGFTNIKATYNPTNYTCTKTINVRYIKLMNNKAITETRKNCKILEKLVEEKDGWVSSYNAFVRMKFEPTEISVVDFEKALNTTINKHLKVNNK